jgi:hypothetical protein
MAVFTAYYTFTQNEPPAIDNIDVTGLDNNLIEMLFHLNNKRTTISSAARFLPSCRI